MKIRTQVVALVSGVALPLVLLAAFVTYQLWQQQRDGYQQKFLERASAVRLALDTEFDVTVRTLRTIGDAAEIPPAEAEVVLRRRFRRLLDNYPDWAAVALTNAQGDVVMVDTRPRIAAPPPLDAQAIQRTISSKTGLISDVVATGDGRHFVFIATAITGEAGIQGVIYAAIDHTHWLDLLSTYPVSRRGTLTLLDRSGTVVARTLNDQQWVGKKAPKAFWDSTAGRAVGAFETAGLDGTPFYAAFSRSNSGWVVSTGVPQMEVDDDVYWRTVAVLLVAVVAVLGAFGAAWRLGRDISNSLLGLLTSADALGDQTPQAAGVLPIREAQAVRSAMDHAHKQLLAREASLNAALEREGAARQQAEQAGRAKDQFLAMMGHELRNPLSTITTAVDLLGVDGLAPPVLSQTRNIVQRQSKHLAAMINDLMDVAQLDAGDITLRRTRLDLARVAAKVIQRFEETGRCTHLQMRTEHVPAWVEADETRLELIITCLLDNACKYTPAGGTVTIEVLGEASSSVLRVRDTGVGIEPELISSMFDAFTQGSRSIERSEGGLGLGLNLARTLVALHGGAITAVSEGQGKGAVFTVTLPAAESCLPAAADVPVAPADVLLTIVEDIADNRDAMCLLLTAQGRRVNAAADGPSGVQLILEGPSDVAVVDIGLPGFDGLEVARRVRAAPGGSRILLIALTGYGTAGDRAKALEAGFDDFLVKPFDPDRLEMALTTGLAAKAARKPES